MRNVLLSRSPIGGAYAGPPEAASCFAIVALIHGRYSLSPEGAPIEGRYAHVWTLRDGKAVYVRATCGRSREELGFPLPND